MTGEGVTSIASVNSTRTVDRALGLLAEVCERESLSLAECARRTRLPASTALRLLRTLEVSGFVARGADGSYRPGARLIQLGAATFGRHALVRLAEPVLRRLAGSTGESAYLSIAGPQRTAVYVAMVEGTHSIRHTSWVGRSVDYEGLAIGEVLTGRTPAAGYVAQRDQNEPDVTAIAAPILRPGGIAGALSLLGPTYRIDDETMHAFGEIVSREATQLADQLGLTARSDSPREGVPHS
jgi:urocanate hydratase